jgi:flagellar L-ring protein precursor FlgH
MNKATTPHAQRQQPAGPRRGRPQWLAGLLLACSALAAPAAAQSLYDEASFSPPAADRRSFKLGDLITVIVSEQSSAVSSADTDADRRAAVDTRATLPHKDSQAGVGVSSDFDGGGRTQRSGRVLAQLTVRVTGIEPSGELVVQGEQHVTVNDELQTITLHGRLRSIDVAENNTVLSSRLADARIVYSGDGVVASRQRPGLWQNVLNLLGL